MKLNFPERCYDLQLLSMYEIFMHRVLPGEIKVLCTPELSFLLKIP